MRKPLLSRQRLSQGAIGTHASGVPGKHASGVPGTRTSGVPGTHSSGVLQRDEWHRLYSVIAGSSQTKVCATVANARCEHAGGVRTEKAGGMHPDGLIQFAA